LALEWRNAVGRRVEMLLEELPENVHAFIPFESRVLSKDNAACRFTRVEARRVG
jgi:hypothetical protein